MNSKKKSKEHIDQLNEQLKEHLNFIDSLFLTDYEIALIRRIIEKIEKIEKKLKYTKD